MKVEIKIKEYYEPLPLEAVRRILHISKRKASYYLKNQYIKCVDTGMQTRNFKVAVKDLCDYLENGGPKITERNMRIKDVLKFPMNEGFNKYLQTKWKTKPNVLTPYEASLLVGYQTKTIFKWIDNKQLKAIFPQGTILIPKEWLIEFLCQYGHAIPEKSVRHTNLIKNYYNL